MRAPAWFALAIVLGMAAPALAQAPGRYPHLQLRACKAGDIAGTWKLILQEENPPGALAQRLRSAPNQYFYFTAQQTYAELAGPREYGNAQDFNNALRAEAGQVRQYVMTDQGFLYLYTKGVATDSLQCQVLKRKGAHGQLKKGDLLLRTLVQDREIFRGYRRTGFEGQMPPPAAPPAPAQAQPNKTNAKANKRGK